MYISISPGLHMLNRRRFCEFHNSLLYNPIQMDIWQRIHTAIHYTLSLNDRVDISFSTRRRYPLKSYLEEMSQVLKTNHIPLVEEEDFVTEDAEPLPVDTSCPGQSFLPFLSDSV